jgi:hypothetical protein
MALAKLGVIADIQFGDFDHGCSEGRVQRFRECPGKLSMALAAMHACTAILTVVGTCGCMHVLRF